MAAMVANVANVANLANVGNFHVARDQVATSLQQSLITCNHYVAVIEAEMQRLYLENLELKKLLEIRTLEQTRMSEEAKQMFIKRTAADVHITCLENEVKSLRTKLAQVTKGRIEVASLGRWTPSIVSSGGSSQDTMDTFDVVNLPAVHQKALSGFLAELKGVLDDTAVDERNLWAISKLDTSKVEVVLKKAAEQIRQKFPPGSKIYNPPAVVYSTLWALVKQENALC